MMAVDATTRAVLDQMTRFFPDVARMPASEARAAARDIPGPAQVEPVHRVSDATIEVSGRSLGVRCYRPSEGTLAAVVFFHGGGWTLCDLDTHDGTCRALANATGALVVSVDYRLAPEHPFPAALDDADAAVRWVVSNRDDLGVDPGRVAVAGDSAGGNLAAAACLALRDRGGPRPVFQLLIYPVLAGRCDTVSYRENAEGYFLTAEHMGWYWDQYVPEVGQRSDPYASPLYAPDLTRLPPAHVVTAEHDPLRDEGEAYANRLREAGVPVTNVRYGGAFHGFFSFGALLPAAEQAAATAHAALRQGLAPDGAGPP